MNQSQDAKGEGGNEAALANFHTHTSLCNHAEGMPEDYIREAIKAGCSALGFSDHCPYPSEDAGKRWPRLRMRESDLPVYIEEVRKAEKIAQAANPSFPVYLGFECEWDREMHSWYKDDLLGAIGADYLILGSHWVITEDGDHMHIADVTDSAFLLRKYIDQTIEGMSSGLYKFIAHPDIFMQGWKEWNAEAIACAKALIDAAEDLNLPLELNGSGMIKPPNETSGGIRFQYPYREFWELVADRDLSVVCNSDAHIPDLVIKIVQAARQYAREIGIKRENIIESIFK